MNQQAIYPLQFAPIYQYRIWGGRRLEEILEIPLQGNDPIGEAWLLSDREDHQSNVVNGNFKDWTLGELMKKFPEQLMGKMAKRFNKFPLLLKFLDAKKMLSVQVHPSDAYKDLLPAGEMGKTEAWVVLKAGPKSLVYAGLKPGTNVENLRESISKGEVEKHLSSFTPKSDDAIFIPAGTVHSLGGDVVVFEVQQNSDVTFRLFDWNHIDAKTGQPRELQVQKALECIDFSQGVASPITPKQITNSTVDREELFNDVHFKLWRISGKLPFTIGAKDEPRILVCLEGRGELESENTLYTVKQGNVFLLPAVLGLCTFYPKGTVKVLEIALPD